MVGLIFGRWFTVISINYNQCLSKIDYAHTECTNVLDEHMAQTLSMVVVVEGHLHRQQILHQQVFAQ